MFCDHYDGDQRREQVEYEMGCASEQQNALAWSRMNMPADDSAKVDEFLRRGFWVLVNDRTAYCPSTDAIMGRHRWFLGAYASKALAEAEMGRRWDDDEDSDYRVLAPTAPARPRRFVPSDDDRRWAAQVFSVDAEWAAHMAAGEERCELCQAWVEAGGLEMGLCPACVEKAEEASWNGNHGY